MIKVVPFSVETLPGGTGRNILWSGKKWSGKCYHYGLVTQERCQ